MWRYEQATGRLFHDAAPVAKGYAGGNCGKNPEGRNNPEMQGVRCIGPLPKGRYTFGKVVEKSHLGPFAIPLIPAKENNMCGRSGFFMHGDTNPSGNASEGCIIMPRAIRKTCYSSTDHDLEVF